jgi:FixJ family two-component response regulator
VLVLVDDDAAVLGSLTFAFETEGFAVRPFRNAEALLASAPADCACYVLDQRLPGMSGLDLLERLRARGDGAPAVLITTHPSRETRGRALAAGVEIVEKPLLGETLARHVREVVSAQRA